MALSRPTPNTSASEPFDAPLAATPSTFARVRSRVIREIAAIAAPRSMLFVRGARRSPPRRVALTFDDGPDDMTARYLDVLARLGARATFFLIGENAARARDTVREYVRRGHEVGCHGWSHEPFPSMGASRLDDEFARTRALLGSCGVAWRLVRPPRGELSLSVMLRIAAMGYTTSLWSLDSDDCRTRDPMVIERRVSAAVASGDVVLFHERQPWTLEALPAVVSALRRDGWQLVTVSELAG